MRHQAKSTWMFKFCIETWYRASIMSFASLQPQFELLLYNIINTTLRGLWDRAPVPEVVWETIGSKYQVACAAFVHIERLLDAARDVPPCADGRLNVLTFAIIRAASVVEHHNVPSLMDPRNFWRVTMSLLNVFALRRRSIAALPAGYQCEHDGSDGYEHCPDRPRGIEEVSIIDASLCMVGNHLQSIPGTDSTILALKSGLLNAILNSGSKKPSLLCTSPGAGGGPEPFGAHHFLLSLLYPQMLVPGVLREAKRSLAVIDSLQMTPFSADDDCLHQSWSGFRRAIDDFSCWYENAEEKNKLFQRCFFIDCPLKSQGGIATVRARKCLGCKFIRYCSPECQRRDWVTHREQCSLLQCSRSSSKLFGSVGLLYVAEIELEFMATMGSDPRVAYMAEYCELNRAAYPFGSDAYPIIKLQLTATGSFILQPGTFSEIRGLTTKRCWKASTTTLKARHPIIIIEFPAGSDTIPLLGPASTLLSFKRPELWAALRSGGGENGGSGGRFFAAEGNIA
ncbi:hypothetical protein HGRIS_008812 [Hohenbuehelia grisea]|uniref:MYND-type domain-containing protein n=1 Tax=Hohenbuehelia grisea TaxID=104357 RepID=A0ABR3J934_9AGAR